MLRLALATAAKFACLIVACGASILAAAETTDGAADKKPAGPFRTFAPGVERVIEPEFKLDGKGNKIVARHDFVEILSANPAYGERPTTRGAAPAKNVRFEQTVQALQFSFKPLRLVKVDIPTPNDRMEQKLVWYMIFHVTNQTEEPIKFTPRLWIEDLDKKTLFPAEIVPVATSVIRRREDPNRPLADVVQVAGTIEPGQDVWGVATWASLDPSMKRLAIFVQGLSSAYQWVDVADKPRQYRQQTLQLNFWRPADPFYEHEAEMRYGLPGDVDYAWLYR